MPTPVAHLPEKPDDAHFHIVEKAQARLSQMSDGNGLHGGQVKIHKHETVVHQLPAALEIILKPDIAASQQAGSRPAGEVVGSKQDAMSKANALAATFLNSPAVLAELEKQLEGLENGGWGIDPAQIALKETTRKTYSVVDKCQKCAGAAKVPCGNCNATGSTPCGNCHGQGTALCLGCMGYGRVNRQDGSQSSCPSCGGGGRTTCRTCSGVRNVTCGTCRGARATQCSGCGGSGATTQVFDVTYHADISFVLDRAHIPEDIQKIIDRFGVKTLASEKRAEIFRLPLAVDGVTAKYPMIAFFPVAKGEVSIAGKRENLTIAGLQGEIAEIRPFLDTYVKPGISALLKLAKGPLALEPLIAQALKYKMLRTVLNLLTHQSKKSVYARLQQDYPLVLSEKYAKAAVKYAANAILILGEGPRNKGLLQGSVASLVLSALYFVAPLRSFLLHALQAKGLAQHILISDILVWVLGYVLTLFTVKVSAAKALKALLPADEEPQKRGLPAAGRQGAYALFLCFAFWSAAALFATEKPEWALSLLRLLKI